MSAVALKKYKNIFQKALVLYSFLLLIFSCRAQSNETDSLKEKLNTHTTQDSARVILLVNYANTMFYEKPDSSLMQYASEALAISKQIHWEKGIALAFRLKGVISSYIFNQPFKALEYYQQALSANDKVHDEVFEVSTLGNIGILYDNMGNYEVALHYYKKCLSLFIRLKLLAQEAKAWGNIGNIYNKTGKYTLAVESYQKGLLLGKNIHDSIIISNLLNASGLAFIKLGNHKAALDVLQESINISEIKHYSHIKTPALINLAIVYDSLRQYHTALDYARQALAMSHVISSAEMQKQSWEILSHIYEKQHQYAKALEAYKNYSILFDSLSNGNIQAALARQEIKYEADKKQVAALAAIHHEKLIKNEVVVGTAILLTTLLIIFIFYRRKQDAQQHQKEAELQAQIANIEMKALRAQMNPHFIFNSLNSILYYIETNKKQSASQYTIQFARLMRCILEHSEQKEITLEEELESLKLYMHLESLRLHQKFTYEIIIDQSINASQTLIAPLILQPFVENSIWHGISQLDANGKIFIFIKKEAEMLYCIIEDNGYGRKQKETLKTVPKKSFGLKITQERLDILNKINNTKAQFKIFDLEPGTRVELRLPLLYMF
jgi:tetratricopeptide (TPR) repeat protein